ncbi:Charged multivesicular body protein 4b Chromatin-modifying protein 4b [Larimichthys crocea]|uniref:Charged multivesicular body protein 4b Chromatin-modifying protein 4b n=1 Tax=Larimichthys crocea TaxID=215358 RepID=A0A6G0IWX0_LARCR|nr:charged multivesicular body protein 4b isoform X2 [Larimichthys crocea]KAE8295771.1 Charged multivesicular body protein 4b Chromatin-modifying protein 4b [Larimichthys crocea]
MSLFMRICSGGEKVRKKSGKQEEEEAEKLPEREESLLKRREALLGKIEQELLLVKNTCRTNRRVALQALRRKKWYEKHLKNIDCAFKAMRSAHEHIDYINKVNELMKDIAEQDSKDPDMSDGIDTSKSFGVEFDEDELLAELERLEKSLDENLFESDGMEERVQCTEVPPTALPSQPAEAAVDEDEDLEKDLEYLRRWMNEPS